MKFVGKDRLMTDFARGFKAAIDCLDAQVQHLDNVIVEGDRTPAHTTLDAYRGCATFLEKKLKEFTSDDKEKDGR